MTFANIFAFLARLFIILKKIATLSGGVKTILIYWSLPSVRGRGLRYILRQKFKASFMSSSPNRVFFAQLTLFETM